MIGRLQSNKCKKLLSVPGLTVVESVDSIKLATKLNALCDKQGRVLPIYIEVFTSGGDSTCCSVLV